MKELFMSDDGKIFSDMHECLDYEWKLKHSGMTDIIMHDAGGNELIDFFSQDTYNKVAKIHVISNEGVNFMQDLAEYTGYYNYADVTEIGDWVWADNVRFIKR